MTSKRTVSVHQNQIVQQRVEMLSLLPKQHPCFAIRYIGRAHVGPQQMPHRVDDQKTFAAFDEFTPIKADFLGSGRTVLDTLRVDDSHCGQRLFINFKAVKHRQLIGNQQPSAVFGPLSKVPVNGLPSGKALGQIPPDNAVSSHVKNSLHNSLKGPNAFSFDQNKFFDTLPPRGRPRERPSGRKYMVAAHNLTPIGGFLVSKCANSNSF